MKMLFPLVILILMTACVGPLLNHETGRSLGKGNHSIKALSTPEGHYGVNYDYGLAKNLDLGVQFEALSLGLKGKYSFINKESGLSLAGALGTGTTWGGSYYTAAVIASYGINKWEHFSSIRYTKVSVDSQNIVDRDTGNVFITTPSIDYDYAQAFLGTKYWFAQWFALSLEAGSFILSSDVDFDTNVYFSLGTDFSF